MNDEFLKLNIQIIPGSSRNEIVSFIDNTLKIKLQAPPVDGKANKACVEFLSKLLKVAKTHISIIKGQTSKHKIIRIDGITEPYLLSKLNVTNN